MNFVSKISTVNNKTVKVFLHICLILLAYRNVLEHLDKESFKLF